MEVFNLFDGELEDRQHPRKGYFLRNARLGPRLWAAAIGATVYELAAGERVAPYHWELGNEEWLLVLDGEVTLRAPDGERALRPGEVVCFPEGPAGAHEVRNDGDAAVRVAIFSTKREPAAFFYPDSRKVGIVGAGTWTLVRSEPQLDYWEGER